MYANELKMKRLQKDQKTKLHKKSIDLYWNWHKNKIGINPQIDGSDGKAVTRIYTYIRKAIFDGKGIEPTTTEILNAWDYILKHYDRWDPYHKKTTRLRQIDHNLTGIIQKLRNASTGKGISRNGVSIEQQEQLKQLLQ